MPRIPKPQKDSKPIKTKVTVYILDDLLHRARVRAAQKRLKMSTLISQLLDDWIKQRP
jgi:hypothetical protein